MDASYTHNLKELVKVADLRDGLRTAAETDPVFGEYWDIVESWSEQSRYGRNSVQSAQNLIEAISDRNHGVFKWVKRYW